MSGGLGDLPWAKRSLEEELAHMTAERDRLQRILDSRPAINAALVQNYAAWSASIYLTDQAKTEVAQ